MEKQRPTNVSGKDEIGTIGTIISIISDILNISSFWVLQGGKWLSCIISGVTIIILLPCLVCFLPNGRWRENKRTLCFLAVALIFSFVMIGYHFLITPTESLDASLNTSESVTPSVTIRYEKISDAAVQFQADVSGVDINPFITWAVTNAPGCNISATGLFTTEGTPCSAIVTGSFVYEGQLYADTCILSVESVSEPSNSKQEVIRYFTELPKGIDTNDSDYIALKMQYNIFDSKDVAIASIANGAADVECENEAVCGHVFYHWCRGEDDAAYYTAEDEFTKNHPHNRRASTEKSADGYGKYNSLTCFYKAEQEIPYPLFSVEGSTSVWLPNYNACWDSYWYWMAEVRECNVRISESVQNFSISIT